MRSVIFTTVGHEDMPLNTVPSKRKTSYQITWHSYAVECKSNGEEVRTITYGKRERRDLTKKALNKIVEQLNSENGSRETCIASKANPDEQYSTYIRYIYGVRVCKVQEEYF